MPLSNPTEVGRPSLFICAGLVLGHGTTTLVPLIVIQQAKV